MRRYYIRFGDVPEDECSTIYRGENAIGKENGVSVYPVIIFGDKIFLGITLPITRTTLDTFIHLIRYDNRPCYLVEGDYIGEGTDGEPLIQNVNIIKEIKYRNNK